MPRRLANDGPSLLSGDHFGVLANIDGRIRLASRNKMPNGDLDDSTVRGGLDGWILEAPSKVVGWYPYLAEEAGKPFHRPFFQALNVRRGAYKFDTTPLRAGQPPDPTDRSRIAAPDRFAVDLVPIGDIGFGPGIYRVAINYGVGSPWLPKRRLLWTEPSDFVTIVVPEGASGVGIRIYLPQDRPEGVTYMGIFVTPPDGSIARARLQEIVNVRNGVRESYPLREGWKRGHLPPARNATYVGGWNQIPAPVVVLGSSNPANRRIKAHGGLGPGNYQLRVVVKTEFGWTLPGKETRFFDAWGGSRTCALWVAPQRMRDVKVEEFAVQVRGYRANPANVTDWQTVASSNGRDTWRPGTFVSVHGWNSERMPLHQTLLTANVQSEDESGVPNPQVDLEIPTTFGGTPFAPGRKRLKATWAYQEQDDLGRFEESESPPSPLVIVDVPGNAGAATHTIRMFRPPGMNEEKNPRFVNLRKDEREEDWIRDPEGLSGAIFAPQQGYSEVTDTTGKITDQPVYASDPVDVTDGKTRALFITVDMLENSYVSGRVRVVVDFLSSSGAVLKTARVGAATEAGKVGLHATLGAPGSDADIRWPSGTTHYRRRFSHIGSSSSGPRNFVVEYKDIGAYPGLAHPKKRYNLQESEHIDEADYPPNAYISVLSRELVDENRIRPQQNTSGWVREVIDFDDGIPADLSFVTDGTGTQSLFAERPISGSQSLRLTQGSGNTSYTRYDAGAGRSSTDAVVRVRPSVLGTAQTAILLVGTGSQSLGWITVAANGDLICKSRNAAGVETISTVPDYEADEIHELRLEVVVSGAGTASGTVKFYASRAGGRRVLLATHTARDFTGLEPRYVDAGVAYAPTGNGSVIEVDEIEVYNADAWEDVPGRMVEYWASKGTPIHPHNGMRGHRVPVEGGKTEIISAFAEIRGASNPTSLLRFVSKNEAGDVLQYHGAIVPPVKGRRRMRRYWRRETWPVDATHIEFIGNALGDGLVRHAGIQLEDDTPDGRPSPFTNEHVSDGSVEVTFNMGIPGVAKDRMLNWLNRLTEWKEAQERSDTPDLTSVTLDFTSSKDDVTYSPWATDLSTVPLGDFFKMRARPHTDDLQITPELYELTLDFDRMGRHVCKGDGTEFTGGAMPVNFPAIQDVPNIRQEEYADNSVGFSVHGERQARADGWGIEAYLDEGVREISNEIGSGESVLVVEDLGKRFHCQTLASPFPPPDRLRGYEAKPSEPGRHILGYIFRSDTLASLILAEEEL